MGKIQKKLPMVVFLTLFFTAFVAVAALDPALVNTRKTELEAELKQYEQQIDEYQDLILDKQRESTSLERDIAIVNAKIAKAKLGIRSRNLTINNLSDGIDDKTNQIQMFEEEIITSKNNLANFLQGIREHDDLSFIELAFVYKDVSKFFDILESFNKLQASLHVSLGVFSELISENEIAKDELVSQKSEELELYALQELEKKELEKNENEKKSILKLTKGEESAYQKVLDIKQKSAASIRSQLFLLRGSDDISFEKALEYANVAEQETGVRPAFLLGIITEESNLGANIGTGNWRDDLSHSRCTKQRTAFLQITSELGLDPDLLPVSKRAWYGYCGGAMGPAQFIPTTWLLFKDGVAKRTGHNPPSPWDPEDAFMASALLLRDNGAKYGDYDSEWKAAMRYLAGSNWWKKAYRFYGDDVMSIAKKYQDQIDLLQSLAKQ